MAYNGRIRGVGLVISWSLRTELYMHEEYFLVLFIGIYHSCCCGFVFIKENLVMKKVSGISKQIACRGIITLDSGGVSIT